MGLINYMREKIRHFLQVDTGSNRQITIHQRLDYFGNSARNRIWYRGDGLELSELYSQIDAPTTMFWKAISTEGMEIRKIHTGIPKLIIKTLTKIITNDFNGIELSSPTLKEQWKEITKKNNLEDLIGECVKDVLIVGDGAFKISFDKEISENGPIIEFLQGENVEYTRKRGRITEVVFITGYVHKNKKYYFKEFYGYGYIKYGLFTEDGKQCRLNQIPQTEWCKEDGFTFTDNSICLAVPVMLGNNEKYQGRGESIFDGKEDSFDALDEAWSQWMDALRAGRTKEYIPECLLPCNPDTGEILKPNFFDNRFIATSNDMSENGTNKIHTENPVIPHDSYLATYVTALDLALQGIISPSTLGIDVKKLDNSEAQREKEKTTLYTRDDIINMLNKVIPKLVTSAIVGYQNWNKLAIEKPVVTVKFGEYANPSFESQVETVGKAKTSGIMSIEASVDELYGDSKDKEWKDQEVARLKAEQGIAVVEETAVADDVTISMEPDDKISTLNGAQITSLMNIIRMIKEGTSTRNEGISIITATLGISREAAETFIENNSEV